MCIRDSPGLTSGWAAGPELTPSVGFSQKPRPEGYADFHEKVTTYAAILMGPAQAIDPSVTPLQGRPFTTDEELSLLHIELCIRERFWGEEGASP